MKKTMMTSTLALAAMAGSSTAAIQFWNGVDASGGWDTITNEWGGSAGADVSQAWVNGNDAVIGGAGGPTPLDENITVHDISYTGASTSMNFSGSALTVTGSMDAGSGGFRFGVDVGGTYTLTNGLATFTGTSSGSVTVGSNGILMMTVGSALTGNVSLSSGTLRTRWGAGENQSMGVLSGIGTVQNNAGSGHAAFDTTWTIGQLSLGTDGTIGVMSGTDSGQNGIYIMKLGVGSHQFDLNRSSGVLTNDFFDMAGTTNRVDVDGATISLSGTGDALELGDSFQLLTGNGITGTAIFDSTAVSFAAPGLEFDTSTFNTDGTITVIASVPEPSSAALLGFGGLALILRRRR